MAWNRYTPWRQGSVLTPDAAIDLELVHRDAAAEAIVVVVSHDCDVANDNLELEPAVEVIPGRRITTPDGNCTHAKVPRRLHFTLQEDGTPIHVELDATDKVLVEKERLATYAPDTPKPSAEDLATLQRWLGSRYRRAAFPDTFEAILKGAKLHERIAKTLTPLGQTIPAIFFDLTGDEPPYSLGIIVLYDTSHDPEEALGIAQRAAMQISDAFRGKFLQDGQWKEIELLYCEPISDEALTYRQSCVLKQWRLEHLSLRSSPQTEMPPE